MPYLTARFVAIGSLIALGLAGGCNRSHTVTVEGSVVQNGQPIKVTDKGYIQVTLQPDVAAGTPFSPKLAECDRATGKFHIGEVKPGKYKVGIEQFDPSPQSDKLNGAFRADTGKIVRDIDGKQPLVIDLAKPQ
jgi:hypothetical protein